MSWLAEAVTDSAKEVAVISGANVPVALGVVFFLRTGFFDVDGFILLLEATALMLIGGAMDLGTSAAGRKLTSLIEKKHIEWKKEDHQKATRKAVVYTLTGVFLFAEALLLAIVTFR